MAILLSDRYFLRVQFGDKTEALFDPSIIKEFTITEDMDRLVPIMKLRIQNPYGVLNFISPPDKRLNKITVQFATNIDAENYNEYKFTLFRSFSDAEEYTVLGYTETNGLFTPQKARGFTGNISTNLQNIAKEEFNITEFDISPSLNYEKTLIQSHWTNAKFLSHLRDNIVGKDGQICYYCFITNKEGKPTFVFKYLDEFLLTNVKHFFIYGDLNIQDAYPIYEYRIINNYKLLGSYGGRKKTYGYFNNTTGAYSNVEIENTNYPSLSQYLLIDGDDEHHDEEDIGVPEVGRSNDFSANFEGKEGRKYYEQLNSTVQMWITTKGMSISLGSIVKIYFPEGELAGNAVSHPYNGYWMVRRVMHIFGMEYMVRLLLSRAGIDALDDVTLTKANRIMQYGPTPVKVAVSSEVQTAPLVRETSGEYPDADEIEAE